MPCAAAAASWNIKCAAACHDLHVVWQHLDAGDLPERVELVAQLLVLHVRHQAAHVPATNHYHTRLSSAHLTMDSNPHWGTIPGTGLSSSSSASMARHTAHRMPIPVCSGHCLHKLQATGERARQALLLGNSRLERDCPCATSSCLQQAVLGKRLSQGLDLLVLGRLQLGHGVDAREHLVRDRVVHAVVPVLDVLLRQRPCTGEQGPPTLQHRGCYYRCKRYPTAWAQFCFPSSTTLQLVSTTPM